MKILYPLFFLASFCAWSQSSMFPNRGAEFNPAVGINGTFLSKKSELDAEDDGMSLQGVELQFNADVDAYFRAQVVIGIHPEAHEAHDHDEEEAEEEEGHGSHNYLIHPEEAYIETIAIPDVTLKAGKFLSQFGKYNAIHLHALPFVYRGQVQQEFFGYEGFTTTGMSASFLLPMNWFSEFTVEALQPENEALFEDTHQATAYVGKVKNLWDLNDATTIEWGISGLSFARAEYNDNEEEATTLVGTDLTLKWKPVKGGKQTSFMWSSEYIKKEREGSVESTNAGITSFLRYQFQPRWFAQGQYEYLGLDRSADENFAQAYTALLGFIPSEFSALRLQYDAIKNEEGDERRVSLQLNISIGAHPAHFY